MQSPLLHIVLFIVYSAALGWAITRMRFFRDSGLRPYILLLLFGLRVATGCLHNVIAYKFYPGHGDIWSFFWDSALTKRDLFTDFNFFGFATWRWIPHNSIQLLHIFFNLFSFDDLYINTLLFSFFVFWGSIALFRSFRSIFRNDLLSALIVLVLPSTLFWTSCVHTEGLLLIGLGFFFYFSTPKAPIPSNWKWAVSCLFFSGFVLLFRPAVFLALLPAALPNTRPRLFHNSPGKSWLLALLAFFAVTLLLILMIPGALHQVLEAVSHRQQEFQALRAHSRIPLPLLEPNIPSFLHILPAAIKNGLFQPLPGTGGQAIYGLFSLELIGIWVLVLLGLYRQFSRPLPFFSGSPGAIFGLSSVFFALAGMIMIGAMIPFAGAIIRYRSIFLPFLLAPIIYMLREQSLFQRLEGWLRKKILIANQIPPTARSRTGKALNKK